MSDNASVGTDQGEDRIAGQASEPVTHESAASSNVQYKDAQGEVRRKRRVDRTFEVMTALMLAVVAVATAWSGYQSARWSGVQSSNYAQASASRVEATRASTKAGQLWLYDAIIVNQWLNARDANETKLMERYYARLRPEFRPFFDEWLALDPFNQPGAPPGPTFLPGYAIAAAVEPSQFQAKAEQLYKVGLEANETADNYVLNTVFLATVLLLVSIGERFDWILIKIAVLVLAGALLIYGLFNLITWPIT